MNVVQCVVAREVDVYVAIGHGRDLATRLGLNQVDRTKVEIVILELSRNILAHAERGELRLALVAQGEQQGLAIEAHDQGPGIENIDLALRDGYSTKKTLGAGLPGVRRLMDDFAIESTPGVGTTVRVVKWLAQPGLPGAFAERRIS